MNKRQHVWTSHCFFQVLIGLNPRPHLQELPQNPVDVDIPVRRDEPDEPELQTDEVQSEEDDGDDTLDYFSKLAEED